ncbi:DUF3784 domain-containing protein [Sporosarcina sp. NPDC096371]|uniref:DUF3784 domain-containing protein n=1 Tax=Sporosarcina sp. NPDC096371 TaxID=3364530 RepID=UPI0037FDE10D
MKSGADLLLLGKFIVCLFVSLLLFFFSYSIWKKKNLSFIAGYDENTFKGDKNKLAKAVGSITMIIGIVTLLLPFALEFIGSFVGILFGTIVFVGTIGLVIYINAINKE